MKTTVAHDEKIAKMRFASVYPLYLAKVLKKGRSESELIQVIEWLTGFDKKTIQHSIKGTATFETFFLDAKIPVAAEKITGLICGYRVEEIENPLTKKVRYLDKLVDELAKGKGMDKIIRQ